MHSTRMSRIKRTGCKFQTGLNVLNSSHGSKICYVFVSEGDCNRFHIVDLEPRGLKVANRDSESVEKIVPLLDDTGDRPPEDMGIEG